MRNLLSMSPGQGSNRNITSRLLPCVMSKQQFRTTVGAMAPEH